MIKSQIKKALVFIRCIKGRVQGAKVSLCQGTYIASGVFFSRSREIKIGQNSYIGRNVSLSCHVDIGDYVLVASNVAFVGGDHKIDDIESYIIHSGRDQIKHIVVEDDVWIGHGAIIMHGVHLAKGCVVGAGSVVTKDVGQSEIVAGNPAKFIRYRRSLKSEK